eukprot:gene20431-21046_t
MAIGQSPYRRLQKRCKDAGVSSKGSAVTLEARLAAAAGEADVETYSAASDAALVVNEKNVLKKNTGRRTSENICPAAETVRHYHRHRRCCGLGRYMNDAPEDGSEYISTGPEEVLNIITHAVGILYALLFVFPVLSAPELKGSPAAQFQGKLYATSMILLFGSSTVYHTLILVAPDSVWCKRAQVFDRSMIFIYIAATYTPMLYFYGDPDVNYTTWFSLWLVWIVGLAGVVYSFFFQGSLAEIQELAMYLVQGAIPGFLAMEPLLATMPRYVGYSMLAGMLSYGVGTIFFSSDGKLPFAHAIWHVCVL